MDDEAERGIAAHWSYKEGGRSSNDMKKWVEWLRKLLIDLRDESHEGTPDAERMINIDDLNKRIYVFTPRRDLIELPEGATPIDFAYQIHTELGHKCRGATVNGKIVPLNYELRPGDTVGIIKANRGGPSRDWMNDSLGYARSGKTRSKVRQWFREHDRQVNITRGREMIERELKRLKLQDLIPLEELAQFFKQDNLDDFLARVGFGDITFTQVTGTIALLQNQKKAELAALEPEEEVITPPPMPQQEKQRKGLLIQGLSGLQHQMANCCQPVPPEPIIGYVTRGRGVSIHHKECDQFKKQAMKEPGRVIEVSWGIDKDNAFYEIPLVVQAFRAPELAESIATMVSGRQIAIPRTKSVSDGRGLTTVYLVVTVKDLQDLEWFMQKVKHMSHVLEVKRQRW
jgi:GTP pyrophosphokinase